MENNSEFEDIILNPFEKKDKILSVRLFQIIICLSFTVLLILLCKFSNRIKEYFTGAITYFNSYTIPDDTAQRGIDTAQKIIKGEANAD